MATWLAFGSSVSKHCHCRCSLGVCSSCNLRSVSSSGSSANAPCRGCALRRLWDPDLFVVSGRRERRPTGRSATRHCPRASSAQWDRDSRWTPYWGNCDEYHRPWWPIPLCGCVARFPSGSGHRTRTSKAPARGKDQPLSEHADDHGISRFNDTNPRGVSGCSALARRLMRRWRRTTQRHMQCTQVARQRPVRQSSIDASYECLHLVRQACLTRVFLEPPAPVGWQHSGVEVGRRAGHRAVHI